MGRISVEGLGILLFVGCLVMAQACPAQTVERLDTEKISMWTNWKTPTLGGRQYWTDVVHRSGWRIQRHADTGHHRLLDPGNIRQAWGSLEQCGFQLKREIEAGHVPPNQSRVVILLHGLMRSSESMRPMAAFLEQRGGYQAILVEYASSRAEIASHARDLEHLIRHLGPEVEEINFVAHSMGNIVVRRYLGDRLQSGRSGADRRIHRMVMIGPPNQGSQMAGILKNNWLFNWIAGVAGAELGARWGELQPTLATPSFEFGIVAGAQPAGSRIKNFALEGPDDFTVRLDETRLPGASDTFVRPLLHSNMMRQPEVMQATLNFLQHGWFENADSRQPIPPMSESQSSSETK